MTATPESTADLFEQSTEVALLAQMTAKLASATEYHMAGMQHFMKRSDLLTDEENHLRGLVFALHVQTMELHRQIEAFIDAME